MFIVNPLTGRGTDSLFITHPSTENRIARLEAIARQMGEPVSDATPTGRAGGALPNISVADTGTGPRGPAAQGQPGRGPWG